ncbi:MAG: RraA family protein [Chloroflexota bacterium]|nr:RraA family protein [Chloroflexota bacterium]MDP6507951.1 RraA family protein [Chloroflexota bacterium]MDP6756639.1 RraA family protein [Chloroflexota bacterium]
MTAEGRENLDLLREFDTPTVCNAIERLQLRDRTDGFMGFDIRCMFPDLGRMVGYAVTATARSAVPGPPGVRSGFAKLFQTLEAAPKPAVLVFQDVGPDRSRSCHFGDMMATSAAKFGAIGLVTDGGVRDLSTVRGMGFHYFAAGATPDHGNYEIVEVGPDIMIGGTLVSLGSLLHADENGVGVFPASVTVELLQAARAVQEREAERMAAMTEPDVDLASFWGGSDK